MAYSNHTLFFSEVFIVLDLSRPNISLQFNFRAMAELYILRLFGNPLEFLPEILPLHRLRHLSLANIRIVADETLRSVNVQIEVLTNTDILVKFMSDFNFFTAHFSSVKYVFIDTWDCGRWRTVRTLVHLDTI